MLHCNCVNNIIQQTRSFHRLRILYKYYTRSDINLTVNGYGKTARKAVNIGVDVYSESYF